MPAAGRGQSGCSPGSNVAVYDIRTMLTRPRRLMFPLALLLAAGPAVAVPSIQALAGWRAGSWQERAGKGPPLPPVCLTSAERILLGSHGGARGCGFTVVRDGPDAAGVTYVCEGGRQGRTDLRRDTADVYTVYAQGLADKHPFANRSEWRRIGNC